MGFVGSKAFRIPARLEQFARTSMCVYIKPSVFGHVFVGPCVVLPICHLLCSLTPRRSPYTADLPEVLTHRCEPKH